MSTYYVIEVPNGSHTNPGWIRCVTDVEYRAETREEAEAEARFSLGDSLGDDDNGNEWRVVAVEVSK